MKIINIKIFLSLYEKIKTQPLPIKTSYKLYKLSQKLNTEVEFFQTSLTSILQKYAKKDEQGKWETSEDGKNILLEEETASECHKEILELENLDVEIPDIKFSLSELDILQISPEEFEYILPFIEE